MVSSIVLEGNVKLDQPKKSKATYVQNHNQGDTDNS
jgi:hypothetical protein